MKLLQDSRDGTLRIGILGELDHHEAQKMIAQMETITSLYPSEPVILDLSKMTFMDSSGLAVVLHLQRSLRNGGRSLTVKGTNPQAMRVFKAAGLPKMVHFEEGE